MAMIRDQRKAASNAKGAGRAHRRSPTGGKTGGRPPLHIPGTASQQAKRQLPQMTRRTLQDNVYAYLREGLMTGEFAPGDHLTIRNVAAVVGTSVMPVREAFRR